MVLKVLDCEVVCTPSSLVTVTLALYVDPYSSGVSGTHADRSGRIVPAIASLAPALVTATDESQPPEYFTPISVDTGRSFVPPVGVMANDIWGALLPSAFSCDGDDVHPATKPTVPIIAMIRYRALFPVPSDIPA